jgi:ribonuclease D
LNTDQLRILRAVWNYRDERAEKMDRPAFKVIPGDVLLLLAQRAPEDLAALKKILRPGSSLVRRHGEGLVEAVKIGMQDTSEIPDREPRKQKISIKSRVGRAGGERIFNALKAWRNHTVQTKKVAPGVVASNDLLKMIARFAPLSIEELEEVPGIRRWQIKSFGPEIVDMVARLEVPPRNPKPKRNRRGRGGQSPDAEPGEGSEPQGE